MSSFRRRLLAVWLIGLSIACGCSGGTPRELPPAIGPNDAGKAALDEYDANHDGVISGAELEKCPALAAAISRYDTNGDHKVTAANIAARIEKWQSTKIAIASLSVVLFLDGQPLAGAIVTAEPEKFLGPAVQPTVGKSDAYGNAALLVVGKPGASYGLYKIHVSKVVSGTETIPARYNAATELGLEFAPDSPELHAEGFVFKLKSK